MDIREAPYFGATINRRERYLGSLISHSRIGIPIVCYTQESNYKELLDLKNNYKLDNLEIKIKNLHDVKLHKRFQELRDKYFDLIVVGKHEIEGRTPEVLWGKFQVLQEEIEISEEKYLYWIDVGLQHVGLFPWWTNPYRDFSDVEYNIEHKFNGSKVLNISVFEGLEKIVDGKVATLVSVARERSEYDEIDGFTQWNRPRSNPIAGFFGGSKKETLEYIESFWEYGIKHLDKDILCHEQSVMKHIHNTFDVNKLLEFQFETHQYNVKEFHDKLWESPSDGLKPVYRCFVDMAIGKNYDLG